MRKIPAKHIANYCTQPRPMCCNFSMEIFPKYIHILKYSVHDEMVIGLDSPLQEIKGLLKTFRQDELL